MSKSRDSEDKERIRREIDRYESLLAEKGAMAVRRSPRFSASKKASSMKMIGMTQDLKRVQRVHMSSRISKIEKTLSRLKAAPSVPPPAERAQIEGRRRKPLKLNSKSKIRLSGSGDGDGFQPQSHSRRWVREDERDLCVFYLRTGQCNLGDKCPNVHDSSKITVCPAFVLGRCPYTEDVCALSHDIEGRSLPDCRHFLQGKCSQGLGCPFRHVKLSAAAPMCSDFIKGSCVLGNSCPKHHGFVCVSYLHDRRCHDSKCPCDATHF